MSEMVPGFRELLELAMNTESKEELNVLAKEAHNCAARYEILAKRIEEKIKSLKNT